MSKIDELAKRLGTSDPRRISLWVRAGGRCEFPGCNDYLLDDVATGWTEVYVAEFAHIVACSDNSIRSDARLSKEEKESIDNQILLCPSCHRKIDKKKLEGEFDREKLLSYKREHEDRIFELTDIAPDRTTALLRLVGRVHGDTLDISPNQARTAIVRESGRFPLFPLRRSEIDIDLRAIPENADGYWATCRKIIEDKVDQLLLNGIGGVPPTHLSVFGFARIPLLAVLGYRLGDKIPADLYQKQQVMGDEQWCWQTNAKPLRFDLKVPDGEIADAAVLALSVSGEVVPKMPQSLRSTSIVEIRPVGQPPGRGILRHAGSLELFRQAYERALRVIEASEAQGPIRVLPAVPLAAAITIGRQVLKGVTPELQLWDMQDGEYLPILSLGGPSR